MSTVADEDPNTLIEMNWGLIPNWSKTDDIKKFTLNSRHETINTKLSFKMAHRCLIFADGFFEWKWLDPKGKKNKNILLNIPHLNYSLLLVFMING